MQPYASCNAYLQFQKFELTALAEDLKTRNTLLGNGFATNGELLYYVLQMFDLPQIFIINLDMQTRPVPHQKLRSVYKSAIE